MNKALEEGIALQLDFSKIAKIAASSPDVIPVAVQHADTREIIVNCEQNSLVYEVRPKRGNICHTKNRQGEPRNCYYRRVNLGTMELENLNP